MITWVYDTREIRPYDLASPDPTRWQDGGWYEDSLPEGDITVEVDCERVSVVIERKQLGDYLGCCGRDRERFEKELARLATYHVAHVIIEAPFALIRAKQTYSRTNPLSAWNSIAAWTTRYPSIHFHPVTNRTEGQQWARTLLIMAAKYHLAERGANDGNSQCERARDQ